MSWVSDFFTKSKNQKKLEKQVSSLKTTNNDLIAKLKVESDKCDELLKNCNKLALENKKLKESNDNVYWFIRSLNKETENYMKDNT